MKMIPVIRCRDIAISFDFYTRILGFEAVPEGSFPYRALYFHGERCDLSSLSGDGEFGSCVLILVDDIEDIFRRISARGFDFSRFEGVHRAPVAQTWGQTELYVDDPDGNTIRFAQVDS